MTDVLAYFNSSGNSGPVGTADEWAALGACLEEWDAKSYPALLHLWEHGWQDDLGRLARELESAEQEIPADEKDAAVAAKELAELIADRAEDDSALALTITE